MSDGKTRSKVKIVAEHVEFKPVPKKEDGTAGGEAPPHKEKEVVF